MSVKKIEIDFGKIITHALSALVATVIVGAAVIVWNAATSVDDKIEKASNCILEQQAAIKATQDVIIPQIANIVESIRKIEIQVDDISNFEFIGPRQPPLPAPPREQKINSIMSNIEMIQQEIVNNK